MPFATTIDLLLDKIESFHLRHILIGQQNVGAGVFVQTYNIILIRQITCFDLDRWKNNSVTTTPVGPR